VQPVFRGSPDAPGDVLSRPPRCCSAKTRNSKKRILDTNDLVRSIYQTPENPVFEVFFIGHGTVKIADLSGKPARFVQF
jgi:uncharacterized pyridoxamine 5'-phosphate oxidase family protein